VYPRGLITLKTFEQAVKATATAGQTLIIISGFGESLIHPQLTELFAIAKQHGTYISLPTNGILLTEEKLAHLIENNLVQLEISIHTEKSLAAFQMAYTYINNYKAPVKLVGNMMSCYNPNIKQWAVSQNVPVEILKHVVVVDIHNWARNERPFTQKENNKWQARCRFLKYDVCVVRWDGKVLTCCADSEGVNYIGMIDAFATLKHDKTKYKLCYKCSPAWFTDIS
jgi:MoaA/NifB/PqqE/SkfB family radical SAM enzyme